MTRNERERRSSQATPRVDIFKEVVETYNNLSMAKEHEHGSFNHKEAMGIMINTLANKRGAIQALSRLQYLKSRESGYL